MTKQSLQRALQNWRSSKYGGKWKGYLYHYSHMANVVSILETGRLLSRSRVIENALLERDSAEREVLENTDSRYMDYARLYFRPQTPPLYRVEGIIPKGRLTSGEPHCPIPVYLIFDAERIFGLTDVKFSDGNLASNQTVVYDEITDLPSLPFAEIYHNTPLSKEASQLKSRVIRRRCAEVIVRDEIPIFESLCYIVCRSKAEKETLLNLLPIETSLRCSNKIAVGPECFHRKRQFVVEADLLPDSVHFRFNHAVPSSAHSYTYVFTWQGGTSQILRDTAVERWTWKSTPGDYRVTLEIDDILAYSGSYVSIPF